MSGFTISHGAAVALGLALDTLYSHKKGMLSGTETERVIALILKLGFALFDPLMQRNAMRTGIWILLHMAWKNFASTSAANLTITLLAEIGRGVEAHEIDTALMEKCLLELEQVGAKSSRVNLSSQVRRRNENKSHAPHCGSQRRGPDALAARPRHAASSRPSRAQDGSHSVRPAQFPAVTCPAQSCYLTGLPPAQHGIVGNGWYVTIAEFGRGSFLEA